MTIATPTGSDLHRRADCPVDVLLAQGPPRCRSHATARNSRVQRDDEWRREMARLGRQPLRSTWPGRRVQLGAAQRGPPRGHALVRWASAPMSSDGASGAVRGRAWVTTRRRTAVSDRRLTSSTVTSWRPGPGLSRNRWSSVIMMSLIDLQQDLMGPRTSPTSRRGGDFVVPITVPSVIDPSRDALSAGACSTSTPHGLRPRCA